MMVEPPVLSGMAGKALDRAPQVVQRMILELGLGTLWEAVARARGTVYSAKRQSSPQGATLMPLDIR